MPDVKMINSEKLDIDHWEIRVDVEKTIKQSMVDEIKEAFVGVFNSNLENCTSVFLPFQYDDTDITDPKVIHILSEAIGNKVAIEFNLEDIIMDAVENEWSEKDSTQPVLNMLKSLIEKIENRGVE